MAARRGGLRTIDGDLAGEGDRLLRWVGMVEEAEATSREACRLANRCRDFYDGKQWTAEELSSLRERHQPPAINNVIRGKVQLLQGLERRGRSDPKAFPRTPDEDNRADVATQVLRYICDDQRFDVVRSSAFENMLIEGVGAAEVIAQQDERGTVNVTVNHVPWERLIWDPHSSHPGFSDATYLGVVIWMDRDQALAKYPGCDDILDSSFPSDIGFGSHSDRPLFTWADAKRKRVRVVQLHVRRGEVWETGTFTRGGFLDGPMPSPYVDRHGNPTCPLIMRAVFTDRENNRYGVVKDYLSQQELINKAESKLAHALSVNRIIMTQGAVADTNKARNEAAKPDGVLVINNLGDHGKFEIQKDQAEISGHFELLKYRVGQFENAGPNASMSGKDPRELSGRAIIAQQSGGVVENEPIADTLRQWSHKVYEAMWMRARQFMTEPQSVRVTHDSKAFQFITINKPVTVRDELTQMPPQQAQMAVQQMGLQPGDPRLNMVLRTENDLDDMDVDITVEEGPDVPTMQAESWQAFMQLPQPVLQQFPPEFFIKANPGLRDKDELLQMLEQHQAMQQQAAAAQAQAAAQTHQAALAKTQADAEDTHAQAVERLHRIAVDHMQITQPAPTAAPMSATPQPASPTPPQPPQPGPAPMPQGSMV